MRILVIGASRGIGRQAVDAGLARGHRVRAFSRGGLEPAPGEDGFEDVRGDARDADAVRAALEGVDAVVLALGIPRSFATYTREVTLFSRATQVLIGAMEAAGPRRLLAVTGFGAGDSREAMSTLEQIGHRALLGRPYADKDRQEALIEASALDWTLVRPVILTHGGPSGAYKVLDDPATWRNGLISRADVADFLIREAEEGAHLRRAVVLAR